MRKIIHFSSYWNDCDFKLRGTTGPSGFDGFNGQDGLIAEVFELKNVDFSYNATDGYTIYRGINLKYLLRM
jgi:hypothetical protein